MKKTLPKRKSFAAKWIDGEPVDVVLRGHIKWNFLSDQMLIVNGHIEYIQ